MATDFDNKQRNIYNRMLLNKTALDDQTVQYLEDRIQEVAKALSGMVTGLDDGGTFNQSGDLYWENQGRVLRGGRISIPVITVAEVDIDDGIYLNLLGQVIAVDRKKDFTFVIPADTTDAAIITDIVKVPDSVEPNPSTGILEYAVFKRVAGFLKDPGEVFDNGDGTITMTFQTPGSDQGVPSADAWSIVGHTVSLYLKNAPKSLTQFIQQLTVSFGTDARWTGSKNFITTTHNLGQSTVSVIEADYSIWYDEGVVVTAIGTDVEDTGFEGVIIIGKINRTDPNFTVSTAFSGRRGVFPSPDFAAEVIVTIAANAPQDISITHNLGSGDSTWDHTGGVWDQSPFDQEGDGADDVYKQKVPYFVQLTTLVTPAAVDGGGVVDNNKPTNWLTTANLKGGPITDDLSAALYSGVFWHSLTESIIKLYFGGGINGTYKIQLNMWRM